MLEHASTANKSDRALIDSRMEWYVGQMGQSASSNSDPLAGSELAAFVAAFEAGSVRGAAHALCLTQSAVTKRILSIEARLGGRLFERGRFGMRPTAFGQALYPSAKQALGALDAVAQAAEEARQAGFSDLRLSASVTIGEFLLPAWLSAFRQARPDVRPQLEITNSTEVLAAVREHRCEIGFVEGLDPLEGLEALTLARDEIVAVIATSHPWARRRVLSPRELLNEPYLTREAASGTRAVATAALATAGIELRPVLQAASAQSLKRALEDGGFTLISGITIEAEQRAGTLTGIPIRGLDLKRELKAIRRRRPAPTGPARALWRWLADVAATPAGIEK